MIDLNVTCGSCGRAWYPSKDASESFPGSVCDRGECDCYACENDGTCGFHRELRQQEGMQRAREQSLMKAELATHHGGFITYARLDAMSEFDLRTAHAEMKQTIANKERWEREHGQLVYRVRLLVTDELDRTREVYEYIAVTEQNESLEEALSLAEGRVALRRLSVVEIKGSQLGYWRAQT